MGGQCLPFPIMHSLHEWPRKGSESLRGGHSFMEGVTRAGRPWARLGDLVAERPRALVCSGHGLAR